jgi:translation initiation factor 3 subunit G
VSCAAVDDAATIRVTNLSEETRDGDLKDLFGRFGTITRIFLAKDKNTQQSKGFAFIRYSKSTVHHSSGDAALASSACAGGVSHLGGWGGGEVDPR